MASRGLSWKMFYVQMKRMHILLLRGEMLYKHQLNLSRLKCQLRAHLSFQQLSASPNGENSHCFSQADMGALLPNIDAPSWAAQLETVTFRNLGGSPAAELSLTILHCYIWEWGQPIFHLHTSYQS